MAITTSGLVKEYPDVVAVDGVDLAVPVGSTYGLIGPNGAGKTTLLSLLAGLRRPTAGSIELRSDRRRVAVLADTPQFEPWLTARETVELARSLVAPHLGADAVDGALADAGLTGAADRRVGGFSRGMLQRVGLASCLVGDPEVLLLDEPSSALDPVGRREILELIVRLGGDRTVILSTHILGDVQRVCDTVGVLAAGSLRYQGPLRDLLSHVTARYQLTVRPPTDGLLRALRATDWVAEADEAGPGRIDLSVHDAGRAEEEIARVLATAGAALVSFVPGNDLETVFLELVT